MFARAASVHDHSDTVLNGFGSKSYKYLRTDSSREQKAWISSWRRVSNEENSIKKDEEENTKPAVIPSDAPTALIAPSDYEHIFSSREEAKQVPQKQLSLAVVPPPNAPMVPIAPSEENTTQKRDG